MLVEIRSHVDCHPIGWSAQLAPTLSGLVYLGSLVNMIILFKYAIEDGTKPVGSCL